MALRALQNHSKLIGLTHSNCSSFLYMKGVQTKRPLRGKIYIGKILGHDREMSEIQHNCSEIKGIVSYYEDEAGVKITTG